MEMKKKVGLLTLDSQIYNYGGILQEYALQTILNDLGVDCEIIDYDVSSETNTFSMKRGICNFSFQKIMDKINVVTKPKEREQGIDVQAKVQARKSSFDTFRKEYMCLSRPYKFPDLEKVTLPYDAVVCGSDQIWNPDFNIPAFFLSFVRNDVKKIIYAASMGKDTLKKSQLKVYKKYMERLDAISVREVSAQKLLEGQCNQDIQLALDPTLLLSGEYWKKITCKSRVIPSDYLFCYFLENTLEKQDAAKEYAEKKGIKIITIPYLHGKSTDLEESFGDIKAYDAGPLEFLNYILNADTVITDSFHATVFSILLGTNYWVFGRNNGNYNMNTRLETLLGYISESWRLINPIELSSHIEGSTEINFELIEELRKSSISFLRKALNLE